MWFREEISTIKHYANEMMMSFDEMIYKKITNNCNVFDIILFQRFFLLMNEIVSKILFKNKDIYKIISSLVPAMKKESLLRVIDFFIKNREKSEELLELFTFQSSKKLDLQYTPLIYSSGGYVFPNTIVAKSNLLRNSIASSYFSNNQRVNDAQGLEPLVRVCSLYFNNCEEEYLVIEKKEYKYQGRNGEIDLIVVSENDIYLIECKCPLSPTNNFELRSSYEHVKKACSQLDQSKDAFNDQEFRKVYFKSWGIINKDRNTHTLIVFGNRLFSGFSKFGHPIRFIHELYMVLNEGVIKTKNGGWRIWKGQKFSNNDLLDFISDNNSYIQYELQSMSEIRKTIFIDEKKLMLKTYAFNVKRQIELLSANYSWEENHE